MHQLVTFILKGHFGLVMEANVLVNLKKTKKNIKNKNISRNIIGWLVGACDEVPHPAMDKASLSVNQ